MKMIDWNKNKWVFKDVYNFGYPLLSHTPLQVEKC